MPNPPPTRSDIAKRYLELLEQDTRSAELAELFTPEFTHREYPNRLNPQGRLLDRGQLLEAAGKAAQILIEQRYEIRNVVESGNRIALEVDWWGTFKIPFGNTPPGQKMHASFAIFLTFEGSRIASQRNYDCFEPF